MGKGTLMAGITLCDHGSHRDQWEKATARIRTQKMKDKTTILTTSVKDSCDEHLASFAYDAWRLNNKDKDFARVVIERVVTEHMEEDNAR